MEILTMKNFLLKFIRFWLFFGVGLLIVSLYNILNKHLYLDHDLIKVLAIGDSRMKYGYNPEYLKGSFNVCQNAEPLSITYYKLKEIYRYTDIENVLLGYSPHTLSNYQDKKLDSAKWKNEMIRRYSSILPIKFILKNIDIRSYLTIHFRETFMKPDLMGRPKFIGAYETTEIHGNFGQELLPFYRQISVTQTAYLDSIILLTSNKQSNLLLIDTPVRLSAKSVVPGEFFEKFKVITDERIHSNCHTVYNDLSEYIDDDKWFFDDTHLNHKGSTLFTKEVNNLIISDDNC